MCKNIEYVRLFFDIRLAFIFINREMSHFRVFDDCNRVSIKSFSIEHLSSQYQIKRFVARDAFPNVYKTYATIESFACSTAICEASFSALTGINLPSRLSMTNERMRNLAFLAFEHERLKSVSIEEVLRKFNGKKNRKVQLYYFSFKIRQISHSVIFFH